MADIVPFEGALSRGQMLVISLLPVDLLVTAKQQEAFEGVDAGHLRPPEPVGVKGR